MEDFERTDIPGVRRRIASTVIAAVSVAVCVGFLDLWARTRWSVDHLVVPLGRFGWMEAASGDGRLVLNINRTDQPLHIRSKFTSHDRRTEKRPDKLIVSSRVIRSIYFDQSMCGFLWKTDKNSLLLSVPYWSLFLTSAAVAFVFVRIWWHRRIGRLW